MNGNATAIQFTSKDKKLQIMKSLAVLSKFMGCYDKWKNIKERYQLKWSNENSVDIFKKSSMRIIVSILYWNGSKIHHLKYPQHMAIFFFISH